MWASKSHSLCMHLAMVLVVGPCLGLLLSSLPSWRGFVLKYGSFASSSVLPVKGIKSMTLMVACMPYCSGKPNWYALLLILLRNWNYPTPWGLSFDILCFGNISFRKWSQTHSLSSKIISLFLLLLCLTYLSLSCCIWFLTFSCNFFFFCTNSAFDAPSLWMKSCGLGNDHNLKV